LELTINSKIELTLCLFQTLPSFWSVSSDTSLLRFTQSGTSNLFSTHSLISFPTNSVSSSSAFPYISHHASIAVFSSLSDQIALSALHSCPKSQFQTSTHHSIILKHVTYTLPSNLNDTSFLFKSNTSSNKSRYKFRIIKAGDKVKTN